MPGLASREVGVIVCMSTSGLPRSLAGWFCSPSPSVGPLVAGNVCPTWFPSPIAAWPMSAMVSSGRGSGSGIGAAKPSRVASVPQAYPLRSSDCAKIVNASWPDGSTMASTVSAVPIRSSSIVIGWTYLAVGRDHRHLQTRNAHVEVARRRAVDEPEPDPLAGLEETRPVPRRCVTVHQIGVRGAGDVGQVGGAHPHVAPRQAIGHRSAESALARVAKKIAHGAPVVVVVVRLLFELG